MSIEPLLRDWPNLLAIVWFIVCFNGYALFAHIKGRTTPCLASVLHLYRIDWMKRMLEREVRIADISAIANLERSVAFFASSTILILAGLVTALGASDKIVTVASDLPLLAGTSKLEWEIKLAVAIMVFIYAFFKFTWSLRQYGFCSVLMGGAPLASEQPNESERQAFVERCSNMISMAANNFNYGLRSYYFSMAVLAWFINAWCFMAFTTVVMLVLYWREFKSSVLQALVVSAAQGRRATEDFRQSPRSGS